MSYINDRDYYADIAAGLVSGKDIMWAIGEREGMGTTASGEDILRGTATSVPIPDSAGEQLEVVSTSANDTLAGSGVRQVQVHYLDAAGAEQSEIVDMNGVTGVALSETNVRFVQHIHAYTVGSGGVADGQITIYKQGASSTIYNLIDTGGNMSLVPNRMVPAGKVLILKSWHATEAQNRRVAVRVRSTDMDGELLAGVFCFKGAAYINGAATGDLPLNVGIPALSIVKISGWPDVAGADVGCGWWGILQDAA